MGFPTHEQLPAIEIYISLILIVGWKTLATSFAIRQHFIHSNKQKYGSGKGGNSAIEKTLPGNHFGTGTKPPGGSRHWSCTCWIPHHTVRL